jgi:hypothetical protein
MDLANQLASIIKSNLVSVGLTSDQIEKITQDLTSDILNVLNEIKNIQEEE